jgi:predicted transcriptional regulator
MNTLSIHLPENLEQQLSVYCEQNHRSKNDVMRFALESFFSTTKKSSTPYELGKEGFGSDETHEGDIAQNSNAFLKARFKSVSTNFNRR